MKKRMIGLCVVSIVQIGLATDNSVVVSLSGSVIAPTPILTLDRYSANIGTQVAGTTYSGTQEVILNLSATDIAEDTNTMLEAKASTTGWCGVTAIGTTLHVNQQDWETVSIATTNTYYDMQGDFPMHFETPSSGSDGYLFKITFLAPFTTAGNISGTVTFRSTIMESS